MKSEGNWTTWEWTRQFTIGIPKREKLTVVADGEGLSRVSKEIGRDENIGATGKLKKTAKKS